MDPQRVYHLAHALKGIALIGVKKAPANESKRCPTWYFIDYCIEHGGGYGVAQEIFNEEIHEFRLNGAGLKLICSVWDKWKGDPYVQLNIFDEGNQYPETTRLMLEHIAECGLNRQ